MAQNTLGLKNILLVGQCIAHEIRKATRVKVKLLEYDSYLKMYFPKHVTFYASDPEEKCKDGDLVLIRKQSEQMTKLITHDLVKILYPYGDVTDPISGEKCYGHVYRKTMKLQKELYGVAPDGTGGFDYDSAPPRGWQEGKKDFTYKPGYIKYHEFLPGHPLYNDPAAS